MAKWLKSKWDFLVVFDRVKCLFSVSPMAFSGF